MDSLILRSKTVCNNISDKHILGKQTIQCSPSVPVIDEYKELSVKMASNEDITGMWKYNNIEKAFEPLMEVNH